MLHFIQQFSSNINFYTQLVVFCEFKNGDKSCYETTQKGAQTINE